MFVALWLGWAVPSLAQSGLRLPERGEGLDPSFARGWLAPDFDRFGFAYHWRDSLSGPTGHRMNWSYTFGAQHSLGMSLRSTREFEEDQRQLSLYGRYWFAQDWAVSAETQTREAHGVLRLQDVRIGVQRRF
ncbi:MAG TPA: hypothetical protein VM489_12385 [Burkholderiales bacterium]|nr:hypothetical protein [Burkholderiales bacterium]